MGYLVLHQAVADSIMNGSYYQHVWVVMGPPAKASALPPLLALFPPRTLYLSPTLCFPISDLILHLASS